jgi:hypothetical protein
LSSDVVDVKFLALFGVERCVERFGVWVMTSLVLCGWGLFWFFSVQQDPW